MCSSDLLSLKLGVCLEDAKREGRDDIVARDRADFVDREIDRRRGRKEHERENRETESQRQTGAMKRERRLFSRLLRRGAGELARHAHRDLLPAVGRVRSYDVAHQSVTNDVGLVEIVEGDAVDTRQNAFDL